MVFISGFLPDFCGALVVLNAFTGLIGNWTAPPASEMLPRCLLVVSEELSCRYLA